VILAGVDVTILQPLEPFAAFSRGEMMVRGAGFEPAEYQNVDDDEGPDVIDISKLRNSEE
jgi:hypothetical protein